MKKVIHIYGASGAGTSTLGRKICEELGYTFMDTDDYFWLPTDPKYTAKRERTERITMMKSDIRKADHLVIAGSLVDWGDELIPLFSLAVRVETDTAVRIDRLKLREKKAFGNRIEKGGDMYQNHLEFLEWAAAYNMGGIEMRSRAQHDEWEKLLQCPIVLIDGAKDLDESFCEIKKFLSCC